MTAPVRFGRMLATLLRPRVIAPVIANTPPAAVRLTRPRDRVPGPLRILLAEDNPVNQKLAQTAIHKMGHDIVVVNNGIEAVRAHASAPFDLVLMDLQMPEMDGFAATAAIRQTEHQSADHIPIVAITAHAMQGDRDRCLAAGMDDYISKPIDLKALAHLIDRIGTNV
jgi:two-component system sensor histidine kinase/response regulator